MANKTKEQRFIKFQDNKLFLRVNSTETELGLINTRKGGLTREQKLRAVAADGKWIIL